MHAEVCDLRSLDQVRTRRSGTIAFITSIGGKIAVPHLLPYSVAEFAEVGLAERAARRIARAIERGDAEIVVTPGAKLAVSMHGATPGLFELVMQLAARLLPRAVELARKNDQLS